MDLILVDTIYLAWGNVYLVIDKMNLEQLQFRTEKAIAAVPMTTDADKMRVGDMANRFFPQNTSEINTRPRRLERDELDVLLCALALGLTPAPGIRTFVWGACSMLPVDANHTVRIDVQSICMRAPALVIPDVD